MNAWLLNEALRHPPTNLCRSAQGLGCVKTRRRATTIEQTFFQIALRRSKIGEQLLILVELRKFILVASQFFEFLHSLGHQLPHRLVAVVAAVPPKPAAPTPGLRRESLAHSAAGMNPSPTVIKS
jgi:hypothetical protein